MKGTEIIVTIETDVLAGIVRGSSAAENGVVVGTVAGAVDFRAPNLQ